MTGSTIEHDGPRRIIKITHGGVTRYVCHCDECDWCRGFNTRRTAEDEYDFHRCEVES